MECRKYLNFGRKYIMALLLSVIVIAAGCDPGGTVSVSLGGDEAISVREGQVLEIAIDSNPTTGYLWSLEGFSGMDVLASMGKYKYVRGSDRIGAGGKQIFSFKAAKKGDAKLIFEYSREWEKSQAPAKRYTAKVTVN